MSTIPSRQSLVGAGPTAALPEPGLWRAELETPRGALVTGGGRRIGRAMALALGRLGWHVAVHHRDSAREAAEVAGAIRDDGGRAETVRGDLAGDAARVFDAAAAAVGPVGLLVNNASIYEWDGLAALDADGWLRHQAVNTLAPVLLTRALAAALPEGRRGIVVNIVDARVLGNRSRHFSYTMSKAGLWTATRLMARELAPRVRVNAIGPGPTLPEAGQSEQQFLERCARLPLGRGASPEEVVGALRFLIATPSMTGQLVALDGGDHLTD